MFPFVKLVATIAACLSLGAIFGALVAVNNGFNPYLCAGLGGVAGIAFGLVAAGESRGRWLDSFFPPGDEATSIDGKGTLTPE